MIQKLMNEALRTVATAAVLLLVLVGVAGAASTVSSSYKSDTPLAPGTVVSISQDDPSKVLPANVTNKAVLTGVVVPLESSLLEVTDGDDNVQIREQGLTATFVSNIYGPIAIGDTVSISIVDGVAAKTTTQPVILGVATEAFDPANNPDQSLGDITADIPEGTIPFESRVQIGKINIEINITDNPELDEQAKGATGLLRNLSEQLIEREISTTRIILAGTIFFGTIVVTGALVYSTVRNAIIAVGRNPLSRKTIWRSLLQVLGIVIVVLSMALGSIYLLLTT